jgi:hypothetical protein
MNYLKAFILLCVLTMTSAFAGRVCSQEAADGSYQCCEVSESSRTCCNFNSNGAQGCNTETTVRNPIPKPAPDSGRSCRWGSSSDGRCCPGRLAHNC